MASHSLFSFEEQMPLSRGRVGHGPSKTKKRRQKTKRYWRMGGTGYPPGTIISNYDQTRQWVVQDSGAWKRVVEV